MRSNGLSSSSECACSLRFPSPGYLVARASGAHAVLEPAFAAGLAIAGAIVLLASAAPSAVISRSRIAPVAFGLPAAALGSAWNS